MKPYGQKHASNMCMCCNPPKSKRAKKAERSPKRARKQAKEEIKREIPRSKTEKMSL